jgi:hypothetical protein
MHVTLIEPAKFVKAANHLSVVAMPPLGLAYTAGSLIATGREVTVVDAVGEAIAQITPFDPGKSIFLRGLTTEQILEQILESSRRAVRASVESLGVLVVPQRCMGDIPPTDFLPAASFAGSLEAQGNVAFTSSVHFTGAGGRSHCGH